jgi:glycosyltransferase involved in cell wall biosynthesis
VLNILVVHEVDWAAKVVMEIHEIPELLARRGHTVVFVDYEESYRRANCLDLVRTATKVRSGVRRHYEDARVEVRTPGLVMLPGLDRLSSIAMQYVEIERTIRRRHIDVVLLYSMPTSGLSTIVAAHKHQVPVIFRAIDVLHKLRPQPIASGIWAAERLGMPRVDWVLALSPDLGDYATHMGTPRTRVSVLRQGMAPEFRPQAKDPALLAGWGLAPNDRVAMFLGTMYEFSGIDYVIGQFHQVVEHVPNAKLLLVGGANDLERFRALAALSPVADRIIFTGMQPIRLLPGLINAADLAFNSFRRSRLTDTVFPEKLPRYMACGKPVLATPLTAVCEFFVGESNGVVFRDLGPDFMSAMAALLGDSGELARLGSAARAFVDANYDWDRTIDELEAVMARLVTESSRGVTSRALPGRR